MAVLADFPETQTLSYPAQAKPNNFPTRIFEYTHVSSFSHSSYTFQFSVYFV